MDKMSLFINEFNNIEVPDSLDYCVMSAIKRGKKRRTIERTLPSLAALFLAVMFITSVNVFPSFASTLKEIPIISEIAEFVKFKSIHVDEPEPTGGGETIPPDVTESDATTNDEEDVYSDGDPWTDVSDEYEADFFEKYSQFEGYETYHVTSAFELLRAIGSDRVIFLRPGDYNLYGTDDYIASGIKNIAIVGTPAKKFSKVKILSSGKQSVFHFENSSNICLMNLNIGYKNTSAAAGSDGDALRFDNCEFAVIENCVLSGGRSGFASNKAREVRFVDVRVADFKSQVLNLQNSSYFTFENTQFPNKSAGFSFFKCMSLTFDNCYITGNPDESISFENINIMSRHVLKTENLFHIQEPLETGNIKFDWIRGYKDFGPKCAKVLIDAAGYSIKDINVVITTDIGSFYEIKEQGTLAGAVNHGARYSGSNFDNLYLVNTSIPEFYDAYNNRHDNHGICAYTVNELYTNTELDCGLFKLCYHSDSDSYYTIHEGKIPSIVSPKGGGYIFEDIITLSDLSLNSLVKRYGNPERIINAENSIIYEYNTGFRFKVGRYSKSFQTLNLGYDVYRLDPSRMLKGNLDGSSPGDHIFAFHNGTEYVICVKANNDKKLSSFTCTGFDEVEEMKLVRLSNGIDVVLIKRADERKVFRYEDGSLNEVPLAEIIEEVAL
ncbi:MAG: right-handed parallel beta-helix repeat-containing protein [Eubacteriales bacterium]|nr:right-handed parallel beta-helix repeat-containing protein [Eubacteriales bacterium]